MGNEETDEKRRITPKKALEKLQTEKLDLRLEQRERVLCDAKENAKKNQGKLTIEELRRCKGFEVISESECRQIIESLFQLALIVYNFKK